MKKVAFIFVAMFLFMSATVYGAHTGHEIYNSMEKTFLWINENTSPLGDGDSEESDYYVIAMSRANRTFDYSKYKKITRSKTPQTMGDAHRIIISNAACDGRFNETFVADCTYNNNLADVSDLSGAILTLCSGEYEVKGKNTTIDDLVIRLLLNQSSNGSFGNDIITTSESIIALSFFEGNIYEVKGDYKTEVYYYDVNNAILRGVNYLQGAKDQECGYGNIKSTAYAIMALDSAGVDCDNDPGFTLNGKSTLDWLLMKQNEDGSFGENKEDTALAVCAIVSHIRAMQGKDNFFNVRGLDRIDSPDIYTEEINLSGTGLKKNENVKPIEVVLKKMPVSTGEPTEQPFDVIIKEEIRDIEKDIESTEETKLSSVILFVIAVIITSVAVLIFIFWRVGILSKIIRKIKRVR